MYFIETDMTTESYNIYEEKDNKYYEYIRNLKNKDYFKNFKVILFTSALRIMKIQKNNIFKKLGSNNLIEYYTN